MLTTTASSELTGLHKCLLRCDNLHLMLEYKRGGGLIRNNIRSSLGNKKENISRDRKNLKQILCPNRLQDAPKAPFLALRSECPLQLKLRANTDDMGKVSQVLNIIVSRGTLHMLKNNKKIQKLCISPKRKLKQALIANSSGRLVLTLSAAVVQSRVVIFFKALT